MTGTGTAYYQIPIQDSQSGYNWGEFVGSTLEKVFICLRTQNDLGSPIAGAGGFTYGFVANYTLFLTDDDVPQNVIWNPNNPHGDIMIRECIALNVHVRDQATGGQVMMAATNVPILDIETNVRRKIDENERLFLGVSYNIAPEITVSWNVTGRVLLRLP